MLPIIAYLGLFTVITALWVRPSKKQDVLFLVGGFILTIFAIAAGDLMFSALQFVAIAASLMKLASAFQDRPTVKIVTVVCLSAVLIVGLFLGDALSQPISWFAVAGLTFLSISLVTGQACFFIPCALGMLVYSVAPYFGLFVEAKLEFHARKVFTDTNFVIAVLNVALLGSAIRATIAQTQRRE